MSEHTATALHGTHKRDAASPSTVVPVPEPRGQAVAGWTGLVLAVALLVLGAFLIRGSLVGAGVIEGAGWFTATLDALDGVEPSVTVGVIGVAVALLGLLSLVIALRPRPHPYRRLGDNPGVYVHRKVVEKRAVHEARQVGGVMAAQASLGRRLDVRITSTGGHAVTDAATESVSDSVSALRKRPPVVMRTKVADPGKDMA